jgi:hypothetical protein
MRASRVPPLLALWRSSPVARRTSSTASRRRRRCSRRRSSHLRSAPSTAAASTARSTRSACAAAASTSSTSPSAATRRTATRSRTAAGSTRTIEICTGTAQPRNSNTARAISAGFSSWTSRRPPAISTRRACSCSKASTASHLAPRVPRTRSGGRRGAAGCVTTCGGTPGAAGSVCHGDGQCLTPPALPGNCCEKPVSLPVPLLSAKCFASPTTILDQCASYGGAPTFSGVCLPSDVCAD